LGLIPLISSDVENYQFSTECGCEDTRCNQCSVELRLDVRCSPEAGQRNVTSNDLIIIGDTKVKPINHTKDQEGEDSMLSENPPILIVKLRQNQHIKLIYDHMRSEKIY